MFITWLDLTTASLSLTYSKPFRLFNSLPIPYEIKDILECSYTNNVNEYRDFKRNPISVAK